MTHDEAIQLTLYAGDLLGKTLSTGACTVLSRLLWTFDGRGLVSLDDLAGKAIGRRSLVKSLRELEAAHLIVVETQGGKYRWQGASRFEIRTVAQALAAATR